MGFSLVTCDWSHSLCAGLSEEEASTAPFHCHIYSPAADPSISSALVSSLVSAIEQLTDNISLLEATQGRELKAIKLHVISLEEVNNRLVQEFSTLKKAITPKPRSQFKLPRQQALESSLPAILPPLTITGHPALSGLCRVQSLPALMT